jgi:hypothetical protein
LGEWGESEDYLCEGEELGVARVGVGGAPLCVPQGGCSREVECFPNADCTGVYAQRFVIPQWDGRALVESCEAEDACVDEGALATRGGGGWRGGGRGGWAAGRVEVLDDFVYVHFVIFRVIVVVAFEVYPIHLAVLPIELEFAWLPRGHHSCAPVFLNCSAYDAIGGVGVGAGGCLLTRGGAQDGEKLFEGEIF